MVVVAAGHIAAGHIETPQQLIRPVQQGLEDVAATELQLLQISAAQV